MRSSRSVAARTGLGSSAPGVVHGPIAPARAARIAIGALALAAWTAGDPVQAGDALEESGVGIGSGNRVKVEFIRETPGSLTLLRPLFRTGTLTAIDSTGLTLSSGTDVRPLELTMSEVQGIQISMGRSSRKGVHHGLLWGAFGGFLAATLVDLASTSDSDDGVGPGAYLGWTALGMGAGGAVGHSIGAEQWQPYDMRRLWHPKVP